MSSENIRSYIRIKPELGQSVVNVSEGDTCVRVQGSGDCFRFENVFGSDSTNVDIYQATTANLIRDSFKGYNCCVFAYGQTSSGKTFTIRGNENQKGLISLALSDIYGIDTSQYDFNVKISYMEIYNECLNDLLQAKDGDNLPIRENDKKQLVIPRLEERLCQTLESAIKCLNEGEDNRKYGKHEMNSNTSRSHVVFRIRLKIREKKNQQIMESVINIIDLAGSEGINKTKAEGMTKKEGDNINKSLLSLSKVIRALAEKPTEAFIGFRESKLTRILQSSLEGNSKTAVICTINTQQGNSHETLNTLKFGVSASKVKIQQKQNIVESGKEGSVYNISSQSIHGSQNQELSKIMDHQAQVIEDCTDRLSQNEEVIRNLKEDIKMNDEDMNLLKMKLKNVTAALELHKEKVGRSGEIENRIIKTLKEENEDLQKKLVQTQQNLKYLEEKHLVLDSEHRKCNTAQILSIKQIEKLKGEIEMLSSGSVPNTQPKQPEVIPEKRMKPLISVEDLDSIAKVWNRCVLKDKEIMFLQKRVIHLDQALKFKYQVGMKDESNAPSLSKIEVRKLQEAYTHLSNYSRKYMELWESSTLYINELEDELTQLKGYSDQMCEELGGVGGEEQQKSSG